MKGVLDLSDDDDNIKLISDDDKNPNNLTTEQITHARRQRARIMLMRQKQQKDHVKEVKRSQSIEENVDTKMKPAAKVNKYKRINELEAVVGLAILNLPQKSNTNVRNNDGVVLASLNRQLNDTSAKEGVKKPSKPIVQLPKNKNIIVSKQINILKSNNVDTHKDKVR